MEPVMFSGCSWNFSTGCKISKRKARELEGKHDCRPNLSRLLMRIRG